jgi:hypothetical protein
MAHTNDEMQQTAKNSVKHQAEAGKLPVISQWVHLVNYLRSFI